MKLLILLALAVAATGVSGVAALICVAGRVQAALERER